MAYQCTETDAKVDESQITEQRLKAADEKVNGKQIVQVSKKTGDVWKLMATLLDSDLFDTATHDEYGN